MSEIDDTYEKAMKKQRRRLWTDKYNSKRFLDLLSDDLSNRKALTWLKSWDDIVFNRDGKV
jgi:chromosome transmission fidelity protein 18